MVDKIEVELKKLGKSEELCTSEIESINTGLSGVARLYKCLDRALKTRHLHSQAQSPAQLQAQAHRISPLIDTATKLLDICATSSQTLTSLRLQFAETLTSLRDGDGGGERSLTSYLAARREAISAAKAAAATLSQLERAAGGDRVDQDESEVSRVLTCVAIINISVIASLLRFITTKPRARPARVMHALGLAKKATGKAATLPAKNGNKLTDCDAALIALLAFEKSRGKDDDTLAIAMKRLEAMEIALMEFEEGLSYISNVLSSIKSSLLNIISLYL